MLKPQIEIDRRLSTNSFGSDNQATQKKTSLPTSTVYGNKMYSLRGKEQDGSNLSIMQQLETMNVLPGDDKGVDWEKGGGKEDAYLEMNSPIDHLVKVE